MMIYEKVIVREVFLKFYKAIKLSVYDGNDHRYLLTVHKI